MSRTRWIRAALIALALPACATSAGSTHAQTAHARPAGQAAQPGSWLSAQNAARGAYATHAGPRGQADQPYAWLHSQPIYPTDHNRLAQDGPSYLGGRAAQPGSWTPGGRTSWTLAQNERTRMQQ